MLENLKIAPSAEWRVSLCRLSKFGLMKICYECRCALRPARPNRNNRIRRKGLYPASQSTALKRQSPTVGERQLPKFRFIRFSHLFRLLFATITRLSGHSQD